MKPSENLPAAGLNEVVQAGAAASHLKRYAIIAAIVLTAGGGGWFWWSRTQAARDAEPAYVTAILAKGDIDLIITATGTLEPTNEVTVGSELSGITLEVNADINDRVTKGQALAKLDTSKLAQLTASSRAAVASAMAKTGQAQATLTESEATLLRQQKLHQISGGRMASPAELDAAIAGAARAKADLLSAQADAGTSEAQLRINENDLEKAVIKAPIDGIILTRSIEPGQTVAASFTAPQLFILAEKLERMILKVAIAEADIGRVAREQSASFTVDAWPDRTYTAKVFRVSYGSAVTDNVVTYLAELDVTNDDLSLRPGMTATADIRVAQSLDVFRVPSAALRFDANAAAAAAPVKKSFVQNLIPMPTRNSNRPKAPDSARPEPATGHLWILKDGKPVSLTVKTGLTDGRFTEVTSPELSPGLAVITRVSTPAP